MKKKIGIVGVGLIGGSFALALKAAKACARVTGIGRGEANLRVALERGIIIADTKFEFGMLDGEVTLIDECLTPDSSRFWPLDQYEAGRDQPSFDKQPLRDWLEASGWNKQPPGPTLPDDVVQATSQRYLEAYRRITGAPLPD